MASRVSFRPRPLDVNKPLCVVKDLAELDSSDALVSRDVTHNHEALDKNNEEVQMVKTDKNRKGKEIPIPLVRQVPTYEEDYLPIFDKPETYLRGKGGTGFADNDFVEYDIDTEDEEWVENLNKGQPRLNEGKFERMLWKLELACSAATEKTLRAAGASLAERRSSAAAASVEHLTQDQAIEAVRTGVGGPDATLEKVYQYWVSKRKRKKKPLLRRLQAPTQPADNNPFNVFRHREKIHRPQTRRRRENNTEAFNKMASMKQNIESAMGVLKGIIQRERTKRNRMGVEIMIQKTEFQSRCQPNVDLEAIAIANRKELEEHQARWAKDGREWAKIQNAHMRPYRQKQREQRAAAAGGTNAKTPGAENGSTKKGTKRKRDGNEVAKLPPPPVRGRDNSLYFEAIRLQDFFGSKEDAMLEGMDVDPVGRGRPRFGRGGRVVFDRMDPISREPLDAAKPVEVQCLPPMEMPRILQRLLEMDKQEEGKKSQSGHGKHRSQPPAKQTPGQPREKHANQQGGNGGRAGPSSGQPLGSGKEGSGARRPSSQPTNCQRRVPGRPLQRKPSKNTGPYQGHGFQVNAVVANGRSAQRS
ncbi:hypothetical protein BSKO_13111 [Bryopsis sp. KO-2023]|nr:hypothetical protein BSKO_13111 [Bryopsis sp. KO-2023]